MNAVLAMNEPRDARAMNRMDPDTKLIHAYLEQWGRETRDSLARSPVSILGRLIEQGPMGAPQPGKPPTDLSERSQVIDACVCRLWGTGQRCIKRYYQSWEPLEVMAKKENMRATQMKEVLRRSRFLILSWLSDKQI